MGQYNDNYHKNRIDENHKRLWCQLCHRWWHCHHIRCCQQWESWHHNNSWFSVTCTQHIINSSWPSDAIWQYESGSTLAQVMACCLMAPSHCLNQCQFLISEALWHSTESNVTVNAQATILYQGFENYIYKITDQRLISQHGRTGVECYFCSDITLQELNLNFSLQSQIWLKFAIALKFELTKGSLIWTVL